MDAVTAVPWQQQHVGIDQELVERHMVHWTNTLCFYIKKWFANLIVP